MRPPALSLFFCLIAIEAKEADFTLQADGFAIIKTYTLTSGVICRKLERIDSPQPRAWYTHDTDLTIYLPEESFPVTANPEIPLAKSQGCQKGISQKTLVGPLKKGKWRVFGAAAPEVKVLAYSRAQEVPVVNGSYTFRLDKSAVVTATIHYYRNSHGGCYEYLPLAFQADMEKSNADLQVLQARAVKRQRIVTGHGLCRALPQTIARGAQQLPPGNYRLMGEDVKRVTLYLAD